MRHYDLVVIGGGINGSGIARDAALRGISTLLVEKKDFGSGTSERSSRLIHGGLRYLEHGDIGLVFESLQERETLLRIAPHLVRPLRFLIPVYKAGKRPLWYVAIGMVMYDLLSFLKSLPNFELLSREEMLERGPGIEPEGLVGGVEYSDGQVEFVERLCLANALSARNRGADIRNYTEVTGLLRDAKRVVGVELRDVLTGKRESISASLVINAAGPWVDELLGRSKIETARKIGGTKGSHILVPATALGAKPLGRAVYVEARSDGRPFFIIPYRGAVLIGTTDEHTEEALDTLSPREHEIDYLIRETKNVFPEAKLSRSSIIHMMAGVRPLPFKGKNEPGQIPRTHIIYDHERKDGVPGLVSIIGGKITTYRNLAEQAVDLAVKKLKPQLRRRERGVLLRPFRPLTPFPSMTKRVPVYGGNIPDFEAYRERKREELHERFKLRPEVADHLISLYGTAIEELLSYSYKDSSLLKPLCAESNDIRAQVPYAIDHEMARTLGDIVVRRTAMISAGHATPFYKEAAKLMAKHLGWDAKRLRQEIKAFEREHATLYTEKPG